MSLQDRYLYNARKLGIPVTIHTINGYQINSVRILGYDNFVIITESKGKQIMLYKHAVSSITPEQNIQFDFKGKDDNDE